MTSKIVEVLQENSRLLSENEKLRELLIESRSWWSPDEHYEKMVNLENVTGEIVRLWMPKVDAVLKSIDAARRAP